MTLFLPTTQFLSRVQQNVVIALRARIMNTTGTESGWEPGLITFRVPSSQTDSSIQLPEPAGSSWWKSFRELLVITGSSFQDSDEKSCQHSAEICWHANLKANNTKKAELCLLKIYIQTEQKSPQVISRNIIAETFKTISCILAFICPSNTCNLPDSAILSHFNGDSRHSPGEVSPSQPTEVYF